MSALPLQFILEDEAIHRKIPPPERPVWHVTGSQRGKYRLSPNVVEGEGEVE